MDTTNTFFTIKIKQRKIPIQVNPRNKGTGAGGANTNRYGKQFEEKTWNESRFVEQGYVKHPIIENLKSPKSFDCYYSKVMEDKTIICVSQNGLKKYMKHQYNMEGADDIYFHPDEAYLFLHNDGKRELKIIEKKEQHVDGSVENKLMTGHCIKNMYEELFPGFIISYAFCVNDFLKNKLISNKRKYIDLNNNLKKDDIPVFFGDDSDYNEKRDLWIYAQ